MGDRVDSGVRIGNYVVQRELDVTSTGVRYEVVHVVLPRRAVLKVMHASSAGLVPLAVQLLREACILEALHHAGVPRVFESGVLADRRAWFTIEQIEGTRWLDQIVAGKGAPTVVATITRDVARILAHAHSRGVIHASLGPDRIALTPGRAHSVCITDWSDARAHDAAPSTTHVPTRGSRPYQAPELARGQAIDDRADVFALGTIAYQALSGALPFTNGRQVPAAERCPDAPGELTQLIDQMLAADCFDRPSAGEVAAELDWLLGMLAELPKAAAEELRLVDIEQVPELHQPRLRRPRWTPWTAYADSEPTDVSDADVHSDAKA